MFAILRGARPKAPQREPITWESRNFALETLGRQVQKSAVTKSGQTDPSGARHVM